MTQYKQPVPTHTVGTDLITVQYDRQMIPILAGLLEQHIKEWNFDGDTGDPTDGRYYLDTLLNQLMTEHIPMSNPITIIYPDMMWSGIYSPLQHPVGQSPVSSYQPYFYQKGPYSSNDRYEYTLRLPAGDYVTHVRHTTSSNQGIYSYGFEFYGNMQIDQYSPSLIDHIITTSAQYTLPEGNHKFIIQCNGKNAASSGYYTVILPIIIKRVL